VQWSRLDREWLDFAAFVKSCPVARAGSAVLYVISVAQDQYEAHLPKDAPVPRFPKPLIVAKDGKTLGRLPVGYPRDPPRSSEVTFTDWFQNFPRQIRVEIDDPAVTGNSTVLLYWHAQTHSYVSQQKQR
jgi:hypothetical protein